jgi:hypothetical protein
VFLGEVVSLCKMTYLNLPEATGVVGLWPIIAVGMITRNEIMAAAHSPRGTLACVT